MRSPKEGNCSLKEVADDCKREVDRLLVYGTTGELEICLLAYEPTILKEIGLEVKPEFIGPYPIPRENIRKIRNVPSLRPIGESDRPNIRNILENLIVTHKEKMRFKEHVLKKEMGARERENLLRLIGAFIEKDYSGNDYRKKDGAPNAEAISNKFHEWLALNDFSDKGISDKRFRNLIPEAYNLIMENKE